MDELNVAAENNIVIALPPKNPDLVRRAGSLKKIAENYVIDGPQMCDCAAEDLRNIKSLQKRLEDQRTSEVGPLNAEVKKINDEYRAPTDWLKEAESILKNKVLGYTKEQERIAQEAQRKADELARQERARLEAEARAQQAEAMRLAQEQAKAQAEQRQAEASARQAQLDAQRAVEEGNIAAQRAAQAAIEQAEQARLKAEQENAAARASQEQAQEKAEAAEMTALVTTAPTAQAPAKLSGVSMSKSWKARVTDKKALLKYIAEHADECADWADIKMTPLNGMAKALKQNMQIPGVEAYPDSIVSARAA